MIVCHCEGVNDSAVRAAVLSGAKNVPAIGDRCRAGTDCGGCHRMLQRLLGERTPPRTAAAAVA